MNGKGVSLVNPSGTTNFDRAIRQNRTATATVTLLHNGAPLAHQEVLVEQKKHQFLFGNIWDERSVALANGELSGKKKK